MMDNLEQHLVDFEVALEANALDEARAALRTYLFGIAGIPVRGSAEDAVAAVAAHPKGRASAAAVVLRAIGSGMFRTKEDAHLQRHVVTLAESSLPEFCAFLGVKPREQTYERYGVLLGAHEAVLEKLEPLRTPYSSMDTLVAARARLAAALGHGQIRAYCRPYHIAEVSEQVARLMGAIARVQEMGPAFVSDVDTCRCEIASGRVLAASHPSFLTTKGLALLLDAAERVLERFLTVVQGRFVAQVVRDGREGAELQKRFPLHEEGRELRVVVPFRNEGPGPAVDVTYIVTSSTPDVAISNSSVEMGTIAPGEFSVAFDVLITGLCDCFDAEIHVEWSQIGDAKRREDLFGVRALAQRTDVDWANYKYWNPYSTEPAQGAGFYGRDEQVETLVARLMQRPMEPSYITGQKRVGKTSLAKKALQQAGEQGVPGELTTGYILWGRVAHENPRRALRQLGEAIERVISSALPEAIRPAKGNYDGTLAPLLDLLEHAQVVMPDRRFAVVLDEFDELPEDLYLKGNLADTLFANIRALTTASNFCLVLVGGENMPFVMERQGAKLNKFSRVNLTYFSRVDEWDDFVRLVRGPSDGVLTWHNDAISAVFNLTNGNPYFSKLICKDVSAKAVVERDGDITAEEVDRAVRNGIAALDTNAFTHLWEDGIRSSVDERDKAILKRRRVLAAIARCLRARKPATLANIVAHRGGGALDEREVAPVLHNFVDRGVLVEGEQGYEIALPIFRLWLVEIGLSRLANDGLSEELASLQQRMEDDAYVQAADLVQLTASWKPYRGKPIGPETVRAWLDQRSSYRDQRHLFTLLKAVRIVGQDEIFARLRQGGNVLRDALGVPTRRSNADRRSDVVLTYVDGEGKSGQRYAADYAEENKIQVDGILPPSSFRSSFEAFRNKWGVPKAIVIVDDVVATGGTLSEKVGSFVEEHCDILDGAAPRLEIFSVFATAAGRDRVVKSLSELPYGKADFRAGEIIESSLFAFEGSQGVFESVDDCERAKALAVDIGSTIYRRQPLGYGGQGLLLVLPNTVPNNSLPLLHSASKDAEKSWWPLFERIANG